MRRMTVTLPDALHTRLRHEAERRGTTISALVQMAIEDLLGGRTFLSAGAGRSGQRDISLRIEEILRSELVR